MRGGRLLAEAPPESLIQMFKAETLEDVFLDLCLKQDKSSSNASSSTVSMNNMETNELHEQQDLFPLVGSKR